MSRWVFPFLSLFLGLWGFFSTPCGKNVWAWNSSQEFLPQWRSCFLSSWGIFLFREANVWAWNSWQGCVFTMWVFAFELTIMAPFFSVSMVSTNEPEIYGKNGFFLMAGFCSSSSSVVSFLIVLCRCFSLIFTSHDMNEFSFLFTARSDIRTLILKLVWGMRSS